MLDDAHEWEPTWRQWLAAWGLLARTWGRDLLDLLGGRKARGGGD